MTSIEEYLRNKIIEVMISQGFSVNPHLKPKGMEKKQKDAIKKIHALKRKEKLKQHREFLLENLKEVESCSISGNELKIKNIELKLKEVKTRTFESKLFLWWNLVWWSLPYERSVGRQMKFIIWDTYHGAPFGLIGLQSPPLKSRVRDEFLGINKKDLDYWINQSMYAQRVGALPPYNNLLGGKMVALSLASNELRMAYARKYKNKKTIIRRRVIPNRLLFITTTSAYGKSSMYERLVFKGEPVCLFIGYTSGCGTFHLPEDLYQEILRYLEQEGVDTKRGIETGPSRKLRLVHLAFKKLKIPNFIFHNIKRGYYIFPNVRNLRDVIQKNEKPEWYDRRFDELHEYWLNRWCIPRSERKDEWRFFDKNKFFRKISLQLTKL